MLCLLIATSEQYYVVEKRLCSENRVKSFPSLQIIKGFCDFFPKALSSWPVPDSTPQTFWKMERI